MKKFDEWNKVKKQINQKKSVYTKEGEIYYAALGENIGFEQNGKGNNFLRPIVVYKKFGKDSILAVPLSTKMKEGRFYFSFHFKEEVNSIALLSQIRLMDTRRLYKKVGRMKAEDLKKMKNKFYELSH